VDAINKPNVAGTEALTRDVTVLNRYGIHARPAALLVKAAPGFACEIRLEKTGSRSPRRGAWACCRWRATTAPN
jgi:hypothetical protein